MINRINKKIKYSKMLHYPFFYHIICKTPNNWDYSLIMDMGKNRLKKIKMRNLIFESRSISRQDVIEKTGLNERSVMRYAAEFNVMGLINEERTSGTRGRPGVIYTSNCDRLCFTSVFLWNVGCVRRITVSATDINSYPLGANTIKYDSSLGSTELLKLVFDMIDNMTASLPNYKLYSIGAVFLDNSALKRIFVTAVTRRYHVLVDSWDYNEAKMLDYYATNLFTGSCGTILNRPDEYRLIMTVNGTDHSEISRINDKIRHTSFLPECTIPCYCGKNGCLESAMSYHGVIKRYTEKNNGKYNSQELGLLGVYAIYNDIHWRATQNEQHAVNIIRENGLIHARAAAEFQRLLKLNHVILQSTTPDTHQVAAAEYLRLTGKILHACNAMPCQCTYVGANLIRNRLLTFNTGSLDS